MSNYAIYQPKNKASEYAIWACNFYVGCSNGCTYCYCKKGILAGVMGQDKPQLKKCFKDEEHAFGIFMQECDKNREELEKYGLFFSFTTDPMLPETIKLTELAIDYCTDYRIPVKILTKRADWLDCLLPRLPVNFHEYFVFGFTLTGHDELEPNASTNAERIAAMKKLHDAGFKTFASIEPIIDLKSSFSMIECTKYFCDLYKVGIKSGDNYDKQELAIFVEFVKDMLSHYKGKVYFKDSLLKQAGISRESLPENCVTRDYNLFK